MANPHPTNSFKKNDKRINRKGAPTLDIVIEEIRELERNELTVKFSEMLRMVRTEIKEIVENPKTCIKDLGIAKAILRWLETGDFRYIQPYIEYIFGKPKENITVDGGVKFIFEVQRVLSEDEKKLIGGSKTKQLKGK
jgi:hypothetical protein